MSEWQPIETAPKTADLIHGPPRVLVFGDCGIAFGKVWHYEDGDIKGYAEGYNGEWKITHWMPLPESPK